MTGFRAWRQLPRRLGAIAPRIARPALAPVRGSDARSGRAASAGGRAPGAALRRCAREADTDWRSSRDPVGVALRILLFVGERWWCTVRVRRSALEQKLLLGSELVLQHLAAKLVAALLRGRIDARESPAGEGWLVGGAGAAVPPGGTARRAIFASIGHVEVRGRAGCGRAAIGRRRALDALGRVDATGLLRLARERLRGCAFRTDGERECGDQAPASGSGEPGGRQEGHGTAWRPSVANGWHRKQKGRTSRPAPSPANHER